MCILIVSAVVQSPRNKSAEHAKENHPCFLETSSDHDTALNKEWDQDRDVVSMAAEGGGAVEMDRGGDNGGMESTSST